MRRNQRLILTLFISFLTCSISAQNDLSITLKSLYSAEQYDKIISDHSEKTKDLAAKDLYYVGMAYYMKSDDNNCLKFMDLSISKDKTDSDAFYIKGMTLNYMGQFDKAIKSFDKAIELYGTSSDYYIGLGDSYFSMKKFDQAIEAYTIATTMENSKDRPFTMIPQAYASKNEPKKALIAFYEAKSKISKTSNSYITVLYNIGLYELLNKNYDKAEVALKELIELSPNDFHSYSKLIQVYYGKKEYEKAEPYKQKLYEAYEKGILKDNLKSMFCFDQFNWKDKLIQVFEKFEVKEGKLYYKHLFYVVNKDNKTEYRIQTENSPIAVELGSPKYAVGMDRDGTHSTFTFIEENFKYDDLKDIVIKILNEEMKPMASSTFGQSKSKKKRNKK